MNGSLRLGSVLGITVRVHVLLLVLVAWMLLDTAETARAAIGVGLLFGIVLLHELGHSVVAMSFGLKVVDITLWPLGGMARMSEIPESPKIEGLIAIAGPIVNFVLAAVAAPLWSMTGGDPPPDPFLHEQLGWFALANVIMGAFNLVPAFPTDGGRILRAILGRSGDWVRATETAVRVGRVFAVGIGLVGAALENGFAPFVALWLWWMGGIELQMVRARHRVDPYAAFREFAARAAGRRRGPGGAPGDGPGGPGPTAPREPPKIHPEPRGDPSGWSAEDIDRLERFRGPLRNWEDPL